MVRKKKVYNVEDMLTEALKNPGVAEILKLYEEMRSVDAIFEATRPHVIYITTYST